MIKKILVFFFLLILTAGCGKKSEPVFDENKQKTEGTKLKVLI